MVTCDVSNLCAMSATSTRPSRSRISTIARRRSSLSTLFLKERVPFQGSPAFMIALSFYIGCFRLSSVRESKVSRWRRALFCASGAERERRLGGGCQPLRTKTDSWRTVIQAYCGTARFLFDHEEANQYIDSGQCGEYLLVHGQIRAGVRPDVTGGC